MLVELTAYVNDDSANHPVVVIVIVKNSNDVDAVASDDDDELKPVPPHDLEAAVPVVDTPLPLLSDDDDTIGYMIVGV